MLLDAGWAAMMRHAALGTEWLLRYKPQSWGPDPAVALFSNLVLVRGLLVDSHLMDTCMATPASPSLAWGIPHQPQPPSPNTPTADCPLVPPPLEHPLRHPLRPALAGAHLSPVVFRSVRTHHTR